MGTRGRFRLRTGERYTIRLPAALARRLYRVSCKLGADTFHSWVFRLRKIADAAEKEAERKAELRGESQAP